MNIAATTEATLQHHLTAFLENDIEELMKDYTEKSFVYTHNGPLQGLLAIRSFYEQAFQFCPSSTIRLEVTQRIIKNNMAYIAWTSDSSIASVPMGTDSFEIENDKIVWQSLAAHILIK